MSKIFGIGLAKTGTSSLSSALQILGYSCIHNPVPLINSLNIISLYDSATDVPVPAMFQLLDGLYLGSKFILTVRKLEEWIISCEKDFEIIRPKSDWTLEFIETHKGTWQATYGTEEFDRDLWLEAYISHEKRVMSHFKHRMQDLCIMNICEGDGWNVLCPFLGKKIPDLPFPFKNKTLDIQLDLC